MRRAKINKVQQYTEIPGLWTETTRPCEPAIMKNGLINYYKSDVLEAGLDEAGRGCLAGPVFAAAVILPHDFHHPLLNDSKQLTDKQRREIRPYIERNALSWSVQQVDQITIDKINILNASILAMHMSVEHLSLTPEHLIVDGNRFTKFPNILHKCIVKGDTKYCSIAAASILAKTYRDDFMTRLHEEFPEYNWLSNKGYPTLEHRKRINRYGITPYHRKSFKLVDEQIDIKFPVY